MEVKECGGIIYTLVSKEKLQWGRCLKKKACCYQGTMTSQTHFSAHSAIWSK